MYAYFSLSQMVTGAAPSVSTLALEMAGGHLIGLTGGGIVIRNAVPPPPTKTLSIAARDAAPHSAITMTESGGGGGGGPSTLLTTYKFRNGSLSGTTQTNPPARISLTFADNAVPSTNYVEVRPHGGGSPVSRFGWGDISTRPNGSWMYAEGVIVADGSYAAYGSAGDTITYDIWSVPGTPPWTSGTMALSDITSVSDIYIKLYGVDFTSELTSSNPAIDWYEFSVNDILTNKTVWPFGLNPTGGYRIIEQTPAVIDVEVWGYIRRHVGGAYNKWYKVVLQITRYYNSGIDISGICMQSNVYGPHASGTLGPGPYDQPLVAGTIPAQPRYSGFMEVHDRKVSDILIGAWGGPNDPRQITIPASILDLTRNRFTAPSQITSWANNPGGAFPIGCSIMLSPDPATPGSALPSQLDPNWVYFVTIDGTGHTYLCRERAGIGFVDGSLGPGYIVVNGVVTEVGSTWTANSPHTIGTASGTVSVNYVYLHSTISGTSGSSMPSVTTNPAVNDVIADGTVGWTMLTANFGTGGSGNIKITPVWTTFSNYGQSIRDVRHNPFWFDPVHGTTVRPWMLGMPDFVYSTRTTQCIPAFEYHQPRNIADNEVYSYIPGEKMLDLGQASGGSSGYDVERAPGDNYDDSRIGEWPLHSSRSLYNPGDRNTRQHSSIWAGKFMQFPIWCHDERTGQPVIYNLGPAKDGTSVYPGFPAGTTNRALHWSYAVGFQPAGSPIAMGLGFESYPGGYLSSYKRHYAGHSYFYGHAGSGSHMPAASNGERFLDGTSIWLLHQLTIQTCVMISGYFDYQRNPTLGPNTYSGIVNVDQSQPRQNGWDMCKLANVRILTPDDHPMKPQINDVVADQALYFSRLKAYNDATYTPALSAWGIMGPLTYQGSYFITYWSSSHQFEGLAFLAVSLGTAYPGFIQACNDFLPNWIRIWDPNQGGCMYYTGMTAISYGPTVAFSDVFTGTPSQLLCAAFNTTIAGVKQLTGQTTGTFVCPGIGQQAPNHIYTPNVPANSYPGWGFIDGEAVFTITTTNFFGVGRIQSDACSVMLQNLAPAAVASWMVGADPRLSAAVKAVRAHMLEPPLIGPTFVSTTNMGTRMPAWGGFQYCYEPKP